MRMLRTDVENRTKFFVTPIAIAKALERNLLLQNKENCISKSKALFLKYSTRLAIVIYILT